MTVVTPKTGLFSSLARGRFSIPNGLGVIFLGWNSLGYENDRAGTYQRHRVQGGKKLIKRWQNWPVNPKTPAQLVRQAVFADAVVAWQALTPEEQEEYNQRNTRKGMSGQQLFMKIYLLTH